MEAARKRGRSDGSLNGNGGVSGSKRLRETESVQSGIGSKSKPCTKFFSTAGCPFGEGCHFLHFVPGGIKAVAQVLNLGNRTPAPPSRNPMVLPGISDGPPAPAKTRMCNKYNTAEGCKFGDKCHFAHGERELSRSLLPSHDGLVAPPMAGRFAGRLEQSQPAGLGAAASFGASATAKISVDASLAGAIIGKGGSNTKQICHATGAKLSIRDHESDPKLSNIELVGTFDQIKQASALVTELIMNISTSTTTPLQASKSAAAAPGGPSSNFKTKMCENFAKGTCTFGDRCHFAHGASEMRKATA